MRLNPVRTPLCAALICLGTMTILGLAGCSSHSTSTNNTPTPTPTPAATTGNMSMVVSDASTEDWAAIDVKVLSIALTPQGGGSPITVYTAPGTAPLINLVELDQIGELLGNVPVTPGTYVSATLTVSANPGDVGLVVSANPETGFPATAGSTIASSQIVIVGATGTTGSLSVPLKVNFSSPLVVTAGQNSAIDLEFNLAHPAFIVDHVPATGPTIWAVNFNPAFRHHPIDDITRLVLGHVFGTVQSISSDNSSISIMRDFPVEPATNPETEITSAQSLNILADSTNGTIFFDMDAKTNTVIKNFSAQAGTLANRFVSVAARFQQDGTLVAVRIWASSTFSKVFLNPEGHVLHVNTTTNVLTLSNEDGTAVPVTVSATTQFFFRTPSKPAADAAPIGTGTGFLTNIVRGFKVHVSVVDPLASPVVAQTVDIEDAAFSGTISNTTTTNFQYTRTFATVADNYTKTLDFVSSSTPNGKDANGNPITGFKWWNFTFPTVVDSGTTAIPDFVAATNGAANFSGTVGIVGPFGTSYAVWNDPANPANAWSALFSILSPTPLPLGAVSSSWALVTNGATFGLSVTGGTNPVLVNASTISGSATQVFQVDRTSGIVTITAQDITLSTGFNTVAGQVIIGAPVKVYGVPQPDGSIKAFVVIYFTGTAPTA